MGMRANLALVPLIAVALAGSGLAVAADNPPANPPKATAPMVGVKAKVLKSGTFVRFGPNAKAPHTPENLQAGDEVEVLGKAPGTGTDGGWYMIRFPRKLYAWVHDKNLQKVEGTERWRVTQDGVKVRDDSTLSNIVATLNADDEVEDRGKKNGNWIAVYPPKAIAYINAKLVSLPKQEEQKIDLGHLRRVQAEREWKHAHGIYAQWAATPDLQSAMTLDWSALAALLAQVIDHHDSASVKREAARLKDGVDNVVREQTRQNIKPAAPMPPVPKEAVVVQQNPPVDTQPKNPPVDTQPKNPPVDTQPKNPPVDHSQPPKARDPKLETLIGPAPTVAPGGLATSPDGWLEQRDVPEVGATHVLIDANSKVVAYLKPKAGTPVALSEYIYALVAAKGQSEPAPAKPGLEAGAPVITVEDIGKVGR